MIKIQSAPTDLALCTMKHWSKASWGKHSIDVEKNMRMKQLQHVVVIWMLQRKALHLEAKAEKNLVAPSVCGIGGQPGLGAMFHMEHVICTWDLGSWHLSS